MISGRHRFLLTALVWGFTSLSSLAGPARAGFEVRLPTVDGRLTDISGEGIRGRLELRYLKVNGSTVEILETHQVSVDGRGRFTVPEQSFRSLNPDERFGGVLVRVIEPLVMPTIGSPGLGGSWVAGHHALSNIPTLPPFALADPRNR